MPLTPPLKSPPETINLAGKLALFEEHWSPRTVATVNDCAVRLVKLSGAFVWHRHEHEDELFQVLSGELTINVREAPAGRDDGGNVRRLLLRPGEMVVIPRGVEHQPVANGEAHVLLVEPRGTVNTGDAGGERTAGERWI